VIEEIENIIVQHYAWRSTDLKNYSWDETFNLYEFNDQQKQYMKNFNIRYECNDARDDYSAQLKKGNSEDGLFPQWMNSDIINSLDENDHLEGADFGNNEPDDEDNYGVNKYTTLGRLGKLRQQEMEETRIGLTEAGWLDNSPNGLNQNEASEPSNCKKVQDGKLVLIRKAMKETKIYQAFKNTSEMNIMFKIWRN
jgi:hypothetical protein